MKPALTARCQDLLAYRGNFATSAGNISGLRPIAARVVILGVVRIVNNMLIGHIGCKRCRLKGPHKMSQANPSWVMTKFWVAAALGAPIYFIEELVAYWHRRVRPGTVVTHRADTD